MSTDAVTTEDPQVQNGEVEKETMETPSMNLGSVQITIVGRSPIICHSKRHLVGELKSRQGIEIKESEERDPEQEYRQSLYPLPPDTDTYINFVNGDLPEEDVEGWGVKEQALKNAMVRGAKNADMMPMTEARSAFFCYGTGYDGYLTIQSPTGPEMREDTVSLPRGGTDLRFRGQFPTWACDVEIEFDKGLIRANQIPYILQVAGFGVGIGDWRPEKNGQFGRFRPAEEGDLESFGWYEDSF